MTENTEAALATIYTIAPMIQGSDPALKIDETFEEFVSRLEAVEAAGSRFIRVSTRNGIKLLLNVDQIETVCHG